MWKIYNYKLIEVFILTFYSIELFITIHLLYTFVQLIISLIKKNGVARIFHNSLFIELEASWVIRIPRLKYKSNQVMLNGQQVEYLPLIPNSLKFNSQGGLHFKGMNPNDLCDSSIVFALII